MMKVCQPLSGDALGRSDYIGQLAIKGVVEDVERELVVED
jgi:hypothetical protein